ncbi:DNA topoisomerase [Flagellimonas maritima]|uniref:DNA topoisomerase n=1 Tax=Flagellimonas maritima TaxID=1383885 RepID=A0A2Z4LTV8_9FLAO|nr:type IA DNA topoisomerase [Allomuricauda aurantiaca]AWX44798.1 DNA topoisomerase [Allomuricauda aurantiaca]
MKTVIAEKPSFAQAVAKVVGATARKDGYLEGNGYQVTWAIGHLVGLSMPQAYGFEKWSLDHLPINPDPFKLEVKNDPGIQKQFNVIKTLFENADEIIVATDAAREGELIYRYIQQLIKTPVGVPIKRLWASSNTDKAVEKALNELQPITNYDNLFYAAKARSEADWLVGINFTQGYTLASGKNKALSIGRVQTATLRLIVDRYLENSKFKSTPFFQPRVTLEHDETPFVLSCDKNFEDKGEASALVNGLKGSLSPGIRKEDKTTNEKSPLPFDLTTLQRQANSTFKYTGQRTLDIVQLLYERHKAVTYPRTDSRYLSEMQIDEVKEVLEGLQNFSINDVETNSLKKDLLNNVDKNKVFNDKKVSDHHAIIPTGEPIDLSTLKEDEKNIFLMITKGFLQTFLPDCVKINRKLSFDHQEHVFSATSFNIISSGWRVLYPEGEHSPMLPEIVEGEKKTISNVVVHEGSTKPKAIFTEASLYGYMETEGKLVQDKKLREALKEKGKGLGTPATRSGFVETLISRAYIERKGVKLMPTEIGVELINSLREISISSPEITAEWEYKLKLIEKGELDYEQFMREIRNYVNDIFPTLLESAKQIAKFQTPEEKARNVSFGNCPKCQSGEVRKGKKAFYCGNWNQEPKCDFTIWISSFNKKLSDKQVIELIKNGVTNKIKGFKSKTGKSYDAKLILDENKKVKLSFD